MGSTVSISREPCKGDPSSELDSRSRGDGDLEVKDGESSGVEGEVSVTGGRVGELEGVGAEKEEATLDVDDNGVDWCVGRGQPIGWGGTTVSELVAEVVRPLSLSFFWDLTSSACRGRVFREEDASGCLERFSLLEVHFR